eukprot:CAMPEP_0206142388 /NCGR_PEP_ID=MMETSP1473-20131121/16665_1 /ASSEMBLY_ACC=CAM_ASM_001109 /TAXON_ID=1461547 /ORGANISM="Stichococcus sp, Strain RCC1054" /LENGTH=1083 /DNA_ID=CAMNT_0053537371 /DNA_START=256 /DNA_END=3510 /DNA_ORIENTATION=+
MVAAVERAAALQSVPNSEAVLQSPLDKRLYRRTALSNGLGVLLISDPEMGTALEQSADVAGEDSGAQGEDSDSEDDSGSDSDGSDEDDDDGDAPANGVKGPKQAAAKKAAAAMAVGVGSFCDPAELQGLSHYLEHMLFMGSEKFPDENDYDAFLASNGGASNAYTDLEVTNYQFDCEPKALGPALDRFAQFFLAPLVKADALEREVSAVNNEFAGVLQSDSCRMAQLRCHTAIEGHPFRGFSWGNRASLWDQPRAAGIPIRDRIVQYYRQQYSAERMSLVVLGGQPLDVLQGWVQDHFSAVPAGRGPRPVFSDAGPPFQGGRVYGMPAVKDSHSITVTFQLPSLQAAYAAKADEYLAHLVGHEGAGSLLSALKARGWATGLSAGVSDGGHERTSAAWLFDVHISLTDAGRAEAPGAGLACVALLFRFLALLRDAGPQEWVFKELRDIAEVKFRFAEEEDACEYVTRLAAELHMFAPAHALKGQWVYGQWDPALVTELLTQMTPQRARIDVQSKDYDAVSKQIKEMGEAEEGTEPWFDMPYTAAPLPAELLEEWAGATPEADMKLPARNEFLPSDFELVSGTADGATAPMNGSGSPSGTGRKPAVNAVALANGSHVQDTPSAFPEPPALVIDEGGLRLWAKTDAAFAVPRTVACMLLASPAGHDTPRAAALTHLIAKLLEDALCETAYQAEVAGLNFEVSPEGTAGLALRLDGFSHRLPALASAVFRALAELKVQEAAFVRVREALARRYRNSNMRPEGAATYARLFALRAAMFHVDAVLPHVESVTAADVQEHLGVLLGTTHLEALLHGNVTAAGAAAVARGARDALGGTRLPAAERPCDRAVLIPVGSTLYREGPKNPEEDGNVCELYLQCGSDSAATRALVDLLEQVAGEPAYDTLRTKQQLGYSVHAGTRLTHGALAFCVVVASSTHGPAELEARIEAFLSSFAATLEAMAPNAFEKHRGSLLAAKLQKDHALAEEADRHWDAIFNRRYNFSARAEEVAELRTLPHSTLLQWYRQTVAPGGAERRKLCIHIAGRSKLEQITQQPAGDVHVVEGLAAWKSQADCKLFDPPTGSLPPLCPAS